MFKLRNFFLILLILPVLASCVSSGEQRKSELNREMHQLTTQMHQYMKQKENLKGQLDKLYYETDLAMRNASEPEAQKLETELQKNVDKIQVKLLESEKQMTLAEMKYQRLQRDYAKL